MPVIGSFGVTGSHDTPIAHGPGVTVGRSGASFGVVTYCTSDYWPLNTALYVVDFHGNNERFAYYLLKSLDFSRYNSGSAQPSLNRNFIHPILVRVPDVEEQRAIARVLGALDDKIEMNDRMNDTLEATARAIFKSWFLDFDVVHAKADRRELGLPQGLAELFPASFQDSELGRIPKHWMVKTAGEVAERIGMGPFGSSIKVETFVTEGVPIISGQHLHGFMLDDNTFNFIAPEHAERLASANVRRGDIVFTHAGNIGQAAYIPENSRYERYVISQRQFFMRCDPSQVCPIFIALYFTSTAGRDRLLENTSSSGVPSIARPVTYLRSIKLAIPPRAILSAFENLVRPLILRFRHNMDESTTLAELRDTLLPKLMSGEIRVREAEKQVRAAL